jgi:filamentous hemagglutinin
MAFAQGVQQLAGNVVGDVKAWKLDAAAKETSERLLKEHPDYASFSKDQLSVIVQSDPGYKAVAAQWGTGGTYSMVATAVAGGGGGAAGGELAARAIVAVMYPHTAISDLTESQKQTVSALSQMAAGLAGGIASNSALGGGTGAGAGKNAVENNTLSAPDEKQRQDAKWSLPYLEDEKKQQAEKLISDLNVKDKAFDAAIDSACKNLSSAQCSGMRQELAAMGRSYDEQMDGQYIGSMGSVYKEGKGQVDALMWQYASADAKAEREANVNRIAENWGVSKATQQLCMMEGRLPIPQRRLVARCMG